MRRCHWTLAAVLALGLAACADDVDAFESCASGPAIPLTPGCEDKDFDTDNDTDQSDFGILQRCYSGEDNPADPNCE